MRFSRGLVKLPVKQIYLYIIIFSTTLYVCLQIAKHQASTRSRPLCRSTHHYEIGGSAPGKPFKQPACTKLVYRKLKVCPDCFRPHLHNISHQLRRDDPHTCVNKPKMQRVNDSPSKLVTDVVVSPTFSCVRTCPYLVVLIPTSATSTLDRNIIRATWASVAKTRLWPYATVNADVHIIFVTAHATSRQANDFRNDGGPLTDLNAHPSSTSRMPLRLEADQYGDILFLDMVDSVHNLTLKLMSGFLWVKVHCPRTKFVLKADSDTFINIPLLLDVLIANEKGLTSSVLGQDRFTCFNNDTGSAYVISADILAPMLNLSRHVQLVYTEDQDSAPISADSYMIAYMQTLINTTILVVDDFFASADDEVTASCDVIEDRKILGKVTSTPDMYRLWWGFFRFPAKCGQGEDVKKVK